MDKSRYDRPTTRTPDQIIEDGYRIAEGRMASDVTEPVVASDVTEPVVNYRRSRPPMITIRLTKEDREALKKRAHDSGMFMEEYCRSVLLGKLQSIPQKRPRQWKPKLESPEPAEEKGLLDS